MPLTVFTQSITGKRMEITFKNVNPLGKDLYQYVLLNDKVFTRIFFDRTLVHDNDILVHGGTYYKSPTVRGGMLHQTSGRKDYVALLECIVQQEHEN